MAGRFLSALRSVLSSGGSLWSDFWKAVNEDFFSPRYGEYEHINPDFSLLFSLRSVIICLVIGMDAAAISAIFNKRVLGDFVRALISADALSKEKAKTLGELGYIKNVSVRSGLRSGITLKKTVKCVEEEEFYEQIRLSEKESEAGKPRKKEKIKSEVFKPDFETAHFYVPEEIKYKATVKFDKKGTNWLVCILFLIASPFFIALLFALLPDLLQMIDNFVGSFHRG